MSKAHHDVIVIGAGPCGSTAAYEIAKAGYDVLLLERYRVAGELNSCGGGLGHFLIKKFDLPEHLLHKRVRKVKLDLGWTQKTYQAADPIYVSVKRTEFDVFLAERAAQAGAKLKLFQKVVDYDPFHKRLKVQDRASGELYHLTAKIVIFADGARTMAWPICRIGVDSRRDTAVGVAYELGWPGNPLDAFEFLFREHELPYGYYWVFPTNDTLNVGMGGPVKQLGGRIGEMLQSFIESRPELRDLPVVRKSSGLIPTYVAEQLHGDGVMVVGDAGGFVNPLTGGGIYLGMVSAQMAARVAGEALQANRCDCAFLSRYTFRMKLTPFYQGLRVFHGMVTYSQRHLERTGKPILGKIFKVYSDIGDFALRRL